MKGIEKRNVQSLVKMEERLNKLYKLADAIEDVRIAEDGSLMVNFKSNLIIGANGNQLFYSDRMIIQQAETLHLNPFSHSERNPVAVSEARAFVVNTVPDKIRFKWIPVAKN